MIASKQDREPSPHVVILGAGPAGVGAAYELTRNGFTRVTVLEQRDTVGGNAGSFQLDGVWVDYGSHRLHPACDPAILNNLRELLGEDLLDRPRHGRIRLQNRWIHFPLKPGDLLLRLPKGFAAGVTFDLISKHLVSPNGHVESFASVLEHSLGTTICREFYFPYARKLWGLPPEELASTQARRRVSGNSVGKILRKVANALPGLKKPGAGRFFYPRRGYGQISQRICDAAKAAGAEFLFGARVLAVERECDQVVAVRYELDGKEHAIATRNVWSTLPVSLLVRSMRPEPPKEVLEAGKGVSFRGMILIYLTLEQDHFSEYDAHYFPEESIPVSRLSEPKNYSNSKEPNGRTVLCAELPADPGSREWDMSDQGLGDLLRGWLEQAGLPVRAKILRVTTRKLRQAYPVYRRGYEDHFAKVDQWLGELEGLLSFGRQGLFVHDNTHHALYMARAAADCLQPDGRLDRSLWAQYREVFETHVVED
ncbi:MAG TPA: FAD-dependent oxidoreductase [Terriglobales bacterium]|nr:FAD-dependent oxidoreductase [Terriglobales bacterium]